MSEDNDGFDEIISGIGDSVEEDEFDEMLDVVSHWWKAFNPGEVFVKGILIVESVKGDKRAISMQSSNGTPPWDIMGLLAYCNDNMIWGTATDDDEGENSDDS